MPRTSRKIVIIGGGVAGLCVAVYARKCGYEVEVLEQHDNAGGLATSWRRGDYTFETCLHWLVGSSPHGTMHAQWQEVFDIDKLTFVYPEEFVRLEDEKGRVFEHLRERRPVGGRTLATGAAGCRGDTASHIGHSPVRQVPDPRPE